MSAFFFYYFLYFCCAVLFLRLPTGCWTATKQLLCMNMLVVHGGSSFILWGQSTYWLSVIVPEGGVGGGANAGWHLTSLLGSQMLGGRTESCTAEHCWQLGEPVTRSWPLCCNFTHECCNTTVAGDLPQNICWCNLMNTHPNCLVFINWSSRLILHSSSLSCNCVKFIYHFLFSLIWYMTKEKPLVYSPQLFLGAQSSKSSISLLATSLQTAFTIKSLKCIKMKYIFYQIINYLTEMCNYLHLSCIL